MIGVEPTPDFWDGGLPARCCILASVKSDLAAQRVRGDVEILARAGLDLSTLLSEIDASIGRAVDYVGACFALIDPETQLMTKAFKFGDLAHRDNHDHEWGTIEYGDVEDTTFTEIAARGQSAAAVHSVTGGDVSRSRRMRDYMIPYFDYRDELRLVARDQGRLWGGAALFRGDDDSRSRTSTWRSSVRCRRCWPPVCGRG